MLVQYCIKIYFLCHNNGPNHLPFEIWNKISLHSHLDILTIFESSFLNLPLPLPRVSDKIISAVKWKKNDFQVSVVKPKLKQLVTNNSTHPISNHCETKITTIAWLLSALNWNSLYSNTTYLFHWLWPVAWSREISLVRFCWLSVLLIHSSPLCDPDM